MGQCPLCAWARSETYPWSVIPTHSDMEVAAGAAGAGAGAGRFLVRIHASALKVVVRHSRVMISRVVISRTVARDMCRAECRPGWCPRIG